MKKKTLQQKHSRHSISDGEEITLYLHREGDKFNRQFPLSKRFNTFITRHKSHTSAHFLSTEHTSL